MESEFHDDWLSGEGSEEKSNRGRLKRSLEGEELSVVKKCPPGVEEDTIEDMLTMLYVQGLRGRPSSSLWQAAYAECFRLCAAENERRVYDSIVSLFTKYGTLQPPPSGLHIARLFSPSARSRLLLVIWTLNRSILRQLPADVKLRIFLESSFGPAENQVSHYRGCQAVLTACSYLGAFWVPNNREVSCWGNDLLRQTCPSIQLEEEEDEEEKTEALPDNGDALVIGPDDTLVLLPRASVRSSVLRDHASICGPGHEFRIKFKQDAFQKLVEFLSADETPTSIQAMEEDLSNVSQPLLFELISLSNYLQVPRLLDATCRIVGSMIRGKKPEEIRRTFNLKNDFTPEEEEQVRKENEWCEER